MSFELEKKNLFSGNSSPCSENSSNRSLSFPLLDETCLALPACLTRLTGLACDDDRMDGRES